MAAAFCFVFIAFCVRTECHISLLNLSCYPCLFSDAPALSTGDVVPTTGALPLEKDSGAGNDDGWDDEALAASTMRKGAAVVVPAGATTKDLVVETKALSLKTNTRGNEQENIAEKLRVEETKAKLAAARKGMEQEAQRIKEEKEKKEEKVASSRFGAAAAGGGKWMPTRSRATGGGGLSSIGWGAKMSSQRKVDTEDENLFPDLAAADAILEKQKAEQPAYKAPTKTPVGGGATWGASAAPKARPKLNLKKKKADEETPATTEEPTKAEETPATEEASPEPAADEPAPESAAPVVAAAAASAPIKPKKKKKKKDLSTFGKK